MIRSSLTVVYGETFNGAIYNSFRRPAYQELRSIIIGDGLWGVCNAPHKSNIVGFATSDDTGKTYDFYKRVTDLNYEDRIHKAWFQASCKFKIMMFDINGTSQGLPLVISSRVKEEYIHEMLQDFQTGRYSLAWSPMGEYIKFDLPDIPYLLLGILPKSLKQEFAYKYDTMSDVAINYLFSNVESRHLEPLKDKVYIARFNTVGAYVLHELRKEFSD